MLTPVISIWEQLAHKDEDNQKATPYTFPVTLVLISCQSRRQFVSPCCAPPSSSGFLQEGVVEWLRTTMKVKPTHKTI